jgi:hypothetical protein
MGSSGMTVEQQPLPDAADLVDRHVREARRLLESYHSLAAVHAARQHLQLVEMLLENLQHDAADPARARSLAQARDQLGAHLIASKNCEDASARVPVVAGVLLKAVDGLSADDLPLR